MGQEINLNSERKNPWFNPIPTSQGQNQPLYEQHETKSGRNRVKPETSQ